MDLEARVTGGKVTHIQNVERNSDNSQVRLNFLRSPGSGSPFRVLTFIEATDFNEHWFESEDQDTLEQLIGITEGVEGEDVKYIICTSQRVMSWSSKAQPDLRECF